MGDRLKDKVALVSGGGSSGPGWGNGKATAVLFAREGAKVLAADLNVIEQVGGCRGDEPAYFDRMVRGVRNLSARRRTWIASGKSRCIRVSGLPLSPPLLSASALGPLRRRLPMPASSSASPFPAYMPNTRITPIRQATIRTIRRRRRLTRRPPAMHLNRAIRLRRAGQAATLPDN